jgi:N-acetylglucosamine-6-phosphate deacetylase
MLGGDIARRKGQLKEGYDADLVVLKWDGTVVSTWIMGEEVYTAPSGPGAAQGR